MAEQEISDKPITKKQTSTLQSLQKFFKEPEPVDHLTVEQASEKIASLLERKAEISYALPRQLRDLHIASRMADGEEKKSLADITKEFGHHKQSEMAKLITAEYERAVKREKNGDIERKDVSENQVEAINAIVEFEGDIAKSCGLNKTAKALSNGGVSRAEASLALSKASARGANFSYAIGRARQRDSQVQEQEADLGR